MGEKKAKKSEKKTITIRLPDTWKIINIIILVLLVGNLYATYKIYNLLTGMADTNGNLPQPPTTTTTVAPQPPPRVEVSADDDPSLGPSNAKVTVIEFSDFQCPFCAAAVGMHDVLIQRFKSNDPNWEPSVPKLKELATKGKIRFVYRDFPLSQIHENAQKAAEAAECADEQGKFWEYHDKLFENQEALGVDSLKQYAVDLGLDTEKFNSCLDNGDMTSEVQKDLQNGQNYGVRGTPAFFVNGQLVSGAQPFSVFEELINQELAK